MLLYIALALFGWMLYLFVESYFSLRRNIAQAKTSGIPYIVIPFTELGVVWAQVCYNILVPVLIRLPYFKDAPWVRFLDFNHSWSYLHEYSQHIGDLFLIVSPHAFHLVSENAEANSQIAARRVEFEKPIEDYIIVNHFGKNVLSSEHGDWKRQRKIIAPAFSEKSNSLVWEQSLQQAEGMLNFWSSREGNTVEEMKIENTQQDTANLALHVICGAGFGVPQIWPHQDDSILGNKRVEGFNTATLKEGHKLTFTESLRRTVGIEIVWLTVLPEWIIRRSPIQMHKTLLAAYDECRQYFRELFEYKRRLKEMEMDEDVEGTMDLMGPLIKASEKSEGLNDEKGSNEVPDGTLTEDEIMGNSFIFLFAGHETSAGTIHFALLFLAMDLAAQSHLQNDIDNVVGSRPTSEWSYAVDLRNLYNSMVGAVLNETLRVTPPVVRSPKINRGGPKIINLDGKTVTIPGNSTYVHLDVVGTNYNPRYFPTSPSKITSKPTNIEDFVPSRWLLKNTATATTDSNDPTSSIIDGLENASFDKEGSLFRPVKGAFIPFADGARACPGRRFAQVEITAVLSVIFKYYSVELDVRKWASDEAVARMVDEEKRSLYKKATLRAQKLIRESVPTIALKMEGESVPLRFVKRGMERFWGLGL